MSRVEKIIVFALICICIIAMLALKAGADTAGAYGVAEFYNPVHIPRDGMVERWLLDPGVSGDIMAGAGSFEEWTGSEGGCTDCPAGITCDCVGFGGGDVNQSTTYLYDLSSSVRQDTTGFAHSMIYYTMTFQANKCYQLRVCYKGEDGTEDIYAMISNATATETYNFILNSWTAPISGISVGNIGTSWGCLSGYVNVGASDKTDYVYVLVPGGTDGTYIYLDAMSIRELDSCDISGEGGYQLSVPDDSDPQFGNSPELQHKPGSGLANNRGMRLDSVDDYVSRADDDTFDPVTWDNGGSFSIGCNFVTYNDLIEASIFSKWDTSNQRSWHIYQINDDFRFQISDDGTLNLGHSTYVSVHNVIYENVLARVCATYEYDGVDGDADVILTVDNNASGTHGTASGPTHNSTTDLRVGADSDYYLDGEVLSCSIWNKVISTIEINKYINPYFPGNRHGDGFYVDTCDQAASHATCTLDKCRDGTPNACQAEGTGVMALFDQYTELCDDNSFETFTGDDSNPDFTSWLEYEDAGGTITAYRVGAKHGEVSARLKTPDDSATASVTSSCIAVTPGNTYYPYIHALRIAGETSLSVTLGEWTDGACSSFSSVHTVFSDVSIGSGVWSDNGGAYTAGGTINSVTILIQQTGSTGDLLVDSVSFKEADYYTPWVHNEGAGNTTYNSRDYRLHSPLSDWSDLLREDMYESGACISTWVFTDWAGDDGEDHVILQQDGTAGNVNQWRLEKASNDYVYFWTWDSAGTNAYNILSVTNTSWTADDWKFFESCWSNDGSQRGHFYNVANSTWYDLGATGGAGTGIFDDCTDELHVGHRDGGDPCDCYQSGIWIVPYNAAYPMEGWNNGRPPVNGRVY